MKTLLYIILFTFTASYGYAQSIAKDTIASTTNIDIIPEYPGGIQVLQKLIEKKLLRIKITKTQQIIAAFIVEKDGSVSNVMISDNAEPKIEKKLRKIFEKTKWTPASRNGLPARVLYKLPINIAIPDVGGK